MDLPYHDITYTPNYIQLFFYSIFFKIDVHSFINLPGKFLSKALFVAINKHLLMFLSLVFSICFASTLYALTVWAGVSRTITRRINTGVIFDIE